MAIDFIIEEEQSGERIDKFLSDSIPDLSRSYIQKLIKEEQVTVNQKVVKSNYKLNTGDQLKLTEPELTEPDIVAEDIPLDILYEDSDLLILNKPAGELSQKAEAKDVSMNEYALGYLQKTHAITTESLKVFLRRNHISL